MVETRRVSALDPAFIVAEIGLNHGGSIERALQLIQAAAQAGADAVKFQKRSPRALLSRDAYNHPYQNAGNSFGATYGEHRKALEFSMEQYRELKLAAENYGLVFFASVWDIPSLERMVELEVPVVKIGSPDLTNDQLLIRSAQTGKPLFLSSGMSTPEELERAVELVRMQSCPFVILHCISIYPTPARLAKLQTLRVFHEKYGVPVGYSGHEMQDGISVAARALGACVIEKHFTLDRSWKGGDQQTSLLPKEFAHMVEQVRSVEQALRGGARTGLLEEEQPQRDKLGKSIVAARDIAPGEVLSEEMLAFKSPGRGLSPQQRFAVLGLRVKCSIQLEQMILPEYLEIEDE